MNCAPVPSPRSAAPSASRSSTGCSTATAPMWTSPVPGLTPRSIGRPRGCPTSCAAIRPPQRSIAASATMSMTTNSWWAGPPSASGGPTSPLSSTPTGWPRTCPTSGTGPTTPLRSPTRTTRSWRRTCCPTGRTRPWQCSGATMSPRRSGTGPSLAECPTCPTTSAPTAPTSSPPGRK